MLFRKGDRIPVLHPVCPLCGHKTCLGCGTTSHTEIVDVPSQPYGWRTVVDGNFCCGCGGTWQEPEPVIATEDVP